MKKRILLLLQLYPPVHGSSAIGESIKASKLINETFDCDYVRTSTVPTGKGGLINKTIAFVKMYVQVYRLLKQHKYDMVYIAPCSLRYPFYRDLGLVILAKWFNKSLVYQFHNKGISVNSIVPSFVKRFFFRNAKVILSSELLYYDIERYVKKADVLYCAYGIKDDGGPSSGQRVSSIRPRLLFFAHMLREKGVFVLLEACKILKERNLDFECNFVGSWYDISKSEFDSFVEESKLTSNVIFMGPQYGDDKNNVLLNTDIFAFPTHYKDECFPLGLLEALRFSLPVVTTSEGAIPEIVKDGETGFIVKQKDADALADKLAVLIQNRSLRETMGKKGRMRYEDRFTLQQFERNLTSTLLSCLN